MTRTPVVLAALAMMVAACGDSTATSAITAATETPTAPTTTVPETTTTKAEATSTQAETTVTTEPAPIGEPFDLFVPTPEEGPVLGVILIRHDSTLSVWSGPGINYDVVTELMPLHDGITGTGQGWQLPSGTVFWEIEVDGVVGWANQKNLTRVGRVDDVTASLAEQFGAVPAADDIESLGDFVAALLVGGEAPTGFGDEARRWLWSHDYVTELVAAPTTGDVAELTYDIVGLEDDSIAGYRLHIIAEPTSDGVSLLTAEATSLCRRGISGDVCA